MTVCAKITGRTHDHNARVTSDEGSRAMPSSFFSFYRFIFILFRLNPFSLDINHTNAFFWGGGFSIFAVYLKIFSQFLVANYPLPRIRTRCHSPETGSERCTASSEPAPA
ncbi:hypothetical protein AAFF_G00067820 [Aldrovandia affinis]|uniref:Uncharacterized protein n=1 Tax=Aldrovandia affinis TaxID=143900 RepID=A0AAD7RZA2_9TELE|nr:hypothetical protein AAFF_G00067820 [Aldrovandia affinis]